MNLVSMIISHTLDRTRVIRPVQQCLTLTATAEHVTWCTKCFDLSDMARHHTPAFDLPYVLIGDPPSEIVPTIPLEPPAWIAVIYPAFALPLLPVLAGVYLKKVFVRIVDVTERSTFEPRLRKLTLLSFKIMTTKDTEFEHLLRREFRSKISRKVSALWFG